VEGYDISNLGATDKVGSMVVFNKAGPVKSQYRKFTIKTVEGQSDVDCLAEVLERRLNHIEWLLPRVFLIDGGRPQVNKVSEVLKRRGVGIPVIGIAKGSERKRNDIILGDKDPEVIAWVSTHKLLLIKVRDEAHRFAITFNRSKRKLSKRLKV
jgi:excinuclease ABC subunit C